MSFHRLFVITLILILPGLYAPEAHSQFILPVEKSDNYVTYKCLNNQSGLSTLFIEHLLQDKFGFMWIATQYGLNVFDGYSIKVYKCDYNSSNSLCSDYVNRIFEDKSGGIWACTTRGMSRFNRINETFESFYPNAADLNSEQNNILSIEEDSKGLLWVFTPVGLFSFNMKKKIFTDYCKDSILVKDTWSLYSKFIKRSVEDKYSNIWFTSSQGLKKFDRKSSRFITYHHQSNDNETISSDDIISILGNKQGDIWFTARDAGLNKIIFEEGTRESDLKIRFKRYSQKTGYNIISDSLINIYIDNHDDLWITGKHGVSKYNPASDNFESYFLKGKKILRIVQNQYGGYWIQSPENFYNLDLKKKRILEYPTYVGVQNMAWRDFYICRSGYVWTKFEGYGIQIAFDWENPMKHFSNNSINGSFLPDNKINKILMDRESNLWLGTYEGLIKISNFPKTGIPDYKIYKKISNNKHSLSDNYVLSLMETKEGEIWIGTANGLSRYNPEMDNFNNFYSDEKNPLSLSHKYVQDIYQDSRGILWVLTQDGPDIYNDQTGEFFRLKNFISDKINSKGGFYLVIAEDSNGNIWLGDFEDGIKKIFIPDTISKKNFLSFLTSSNFKIESYHNIPKNKASICSNSINCLYSDKKGRFWIGTGKGLNLYLPEQNEFLSIYKTDGLENEVICGILDDDKGNLWLSTKKGISKVVIPNANLDTIKGHFEIINLNMSDGLQGLEYIEKSFCKSKSGLMFFGGFNGFDFFFPDSINTESAFPEIYITHFSKFYKRVFFEKPMNEITEIKLKYKDDVFSFEFVAIDYKNPERIQYKYKLEYFDKDWIECGNSRIANYTNIPPGEYIFRVKSTNDIGRWNVKEASVKIIISPPFWETWWFRILFILFITSMIAFYVRIRLQNLTSQKILLQKLVDERTLEIKDKNEKLNDQNIRIQHINEELKQTNEEIKAQRDLLQIQNKDIQDSITYAKRIQSAVLPATEYIDEILPDNFILFKPRNLVSGDFYWVKQINHLIAIAVADCTGHGVPGAIMSMLGISFLNEIVHKNEITNPAQALNELRKQLKQALRQTGKKGGTEDGMDMALCVLDTKSKVLQYAGAINPLYLFHQGEFVEYKADRMPVGFYPKEKPSFSNHEIKLDEGDIFYLFTDGYIDQFGGAFGYTFKSINFQKLIKENFHRPMAIQKEILEEELQKWMDGYEQIDDILVMGVKMQ